jgi:WD40 repeat protein
MPPHCCHLLVAACLALATVPQIRGEPPPTDCYGDPLPPGAIARMGTLRFRHPDAHSGIPAAFAPDGKVLATGDGRTLRFWDTSTGKLLRATRENYQLGLLHFSPDGKLLAVQGSDAVCLLDPTTTKLVRRVETRGIVLAFSPDSKLLATAGENGDTFLWKTATGDQVRRLHSLLDQPVHTGGFTADGKTLVTMCWGKRVCRWNVATGERLGIVELPLPQRPSWRTLELSPDAQTLAITPYSREPVGLWDTATGKERCRLQGTMAWSLYGRAFTPDSRTLATNCPDPQHGQTVISLWDTANGKLRRRFAVPEGTAESIQFAPDGRTLLTQGGSVIRLWDTATGKRLIPHAAHEDLVTALAFTRDGRKLLSGSHDGTIRVWDAMTGRHERELTGHRWGVSQLVLWPDGKALLSGGGDGTLLLQELLTGKRLRRFVIDRPPEGLEEPGTRVMSLAMAPDGRSAISLSRVAPANEPRFQVWDLATGKELARRTLKDALFYQNGVFSADARLWLGCHDSHIEPAKKDATPGVVNDRAGKTFAVIQRATTGQELLTLRLPDENGNYHLFAPDGRTLVTTTYRVPSTRAYSERCNALRLWELASGKERLTIELPAEGDGFHILQEAISPNGRILAAARTDGVLQVWDIASGKQLLRRTGFEAAAYRLAFAPDGKRLASGHTDGTILVWDLTPEIDSRPAAPRPTPEAVERWWTDLAGEDARKAHSAIWNLTDAAGLAVAWLEERLHPASAPAAEKVRALIADLDHEEFTRREAAFRQLRDMEELAEPAIRAALQGDLAPEPRRRLKQLLESSLLVRSSEKLRHLRAIEILEQIGSAEGQRILTRLAAGTPEARLTQEAKASLERLARRSPPAP